MTGPGDEMAAAAAARGQVRVSLADREQAVEMVKAAFVQGRLDRGVKWGAYGLITPAVLAAAAAAAVLSGSDAVGGVAMMTAMTIAFLYFVLWLFVGADLLGQWRKERSRGHPRRAPGLLRL